MFYYRNFCRVISLLHGFNYENIFLIPCHIFLKKKEIIHGLFKVDCLLKVNFLECRFPELMHLNCFCKELFLAAN